MNYLSPSPSSPTMLDVAKLADVSVATVSRVLNNRSNVSETSREKVVAACNLLGYERNTYAMALRTGTVNTISLIVANLSQPWYSKLASSLKYRLQQLDYGTIIHDLKSPGPSPSDLSQLSQVISRINPRDNSGVILSVATNIDSPEIIQSLYRLCEKVPLVVIGQPLEGAPWATVTFVDREGTRDATEYLYSYGRRRVAFLGSSPNSYLADQRQAGYLDAANEADCLDPDLIWEVTGHSFQHGYDAVEAQYDRGIDFDAIIATNDELAIGAMRLLKERGVSIPDSVAVIGFGDSDVAAYLPSTTLTSVTGPAEEVAMLVSGALTELIAGGRPAPVQYVRRELIARESTGADSSR